MRKSIKPLGEKQPKKDYREFFCYQCDGVFRSWFVSMFVPVLPATIVCMFYNKETALVNPVCMIALLVVSLLMVVLKDLKLKGIRCYKTYLVMNYKNVEYSHVSDIIYLTNSALPTMPARGGVYHKESFLTLKNGCVVLAEIKDPSILLIRFLKKNCKNAKFSMETTKDFLPGLIVWLVFFVPMSFVWCWV